MVRRMLDAPVPERDGDEDRKPGGKTRIKRDTSLAEQPFNGESKRWKAWG